MIKKSKVPVSKTELFRIARDNYKNAERPDSGIQRNAKTADGGSRKE